MATELSSGTLINNRYIIQRVLGQGGFGRTYLAVDKQRFEEKCVLKEFIFNDSDDVQKAQELFEREAKTLYHLNHPQLPKFFAWFQDNGRLFLAQEYVNGKTYDELQIERLQQGRVFEEAEVIQLLRDLLPVLQYIHEHNIIHRDISTDNIMLPVDSSKPMLIDFGAVKYEIAKIQTTVSNYLGNLDQVTIVGKQGYSSPEQLRMGECFPNSDLYALAVTVVVLLTGKNPKELFDHYSLEWKWRSYVTVSELLGEILDKMLEEKPQQRYQSASEVLAALQELELSRLSTQMVAPPSLPASTSRNLSPKFSTSILEKKMLLSFLGSLLLVFALGGILSKTQPLCQIFDNCSVDLQQEKKGQQLYKEATEEAKEANIIFQNAKTLVDLENASESMRKAIFKLETISEESSVYEDIQNNLANYQNQLEEINAGLNKERQAQQLLREAEEIAKNANELTNVADNISQLEEAKARWIEAVEKLNSINQDSLVAEQTKESLQEYQGNLKDIERRLQKLETAQETPIPPSPSFQPTPNQSPSNSDLPPCDVVLFGECESE